MDDLFLYLQTLMPDGRIQYLSAVCMSCLEGWSVNLYCRCCKTKWDGSSLVLGTCYSYDIFAATPCCRERLAVSWMIFFTPMVYSWVASVKRSHCFRFAGAIYTC